MIMESAHMRCCRRFLYLFGCIALFGLAFQSCLVQGLTNDFKQLTDDQKTLIQPFENLNALEPDKVYKVNAAQLKANMLEIPKSIVHIFNGACPHQTTLISDFEKYAKEHGYRLFMVLIGYTDLSKTTMQTYEGPLFVIDNDYYDEKYGFRYIRYFRNDLMGKPLKSKEKDYAGDSFFFEYGELKQITNSLSETVYLQ
jgi:hypothetical protein